MTSDRTNRFAAFAPPLSRRRAAIGQTASPSQPVLVPRSHYVRLRALLAAACLVIIGLTIAVVSLATTGNVGSAEHAAQVSTSAKATDRGERLDHRGLKDGPYVLSILELGARLDHRGATASSHP